MTVTDNDGVPGRAAGSSIGYNPYDPDFVANPFPVYQHMRDEAPVYWSELFNRWVLTRYDDIVEACTDVDRFSSAGKVNFGNAASNRTGMERTDDPKHMVLRKVVAGLFTPRAVKNFELTVRAKVVALLDGMDGDSMEMVSQFNQLLPMNVVSDMLGLPEEVRLPFAGYAQSLSRMSPLEPATIEAAEHDMEKMAEYFADSFATRPDGADDDIMTVVAKAWKSGVVTRAEAAAICQVIVVGGNDTTSNLIGNTIVALAEHPDQRTEVIANPALIPGLLEESLRWNAPATAFGRRIACDTTFRGTQLTEGQQILLVFASGNRDERHFPDGERFDIHRTDKRSLAFGHGAHFCLGAFLARLEGRIAFEEISRRYDGWDVETPVDWVAAGPIRGPQKLNVTFHRRTAAAN